MSAIEAHAEHLDSVRIIRTIDGHYRVFELVNEAQVSKCTIPIDIATDAFVSFTCQGFCWYFRFDFTRFQLLRVNGQLYPSGHLQFLYLRGLLIDGTEELVLPTSVPGSASTT